MDQEVLSTWDDLICQLEALNYQLHEFHCVFWLRVSMALSRFSSLSMSQFSTFLFFMATVANSPRVSSSMHPFRDPFVVGTTSGHQKASWSIRRRRIRVHLPSFFILPCLLLVPFFNFFYLPCFPTYLFVIYFFDSQHGITCRNRWTVIG